MSMRIKLAALGATALLIVPTAGLAVGSGGGGGGSMPSASGPSEPTYDPVQEYARGTAAMQAGKYKDAARAFEHVTDATPKAANAWFMLGMARAGDNDLKGAAKAYAQAVKLDPAPVAAHREYALALAKTKQTDKANAELAVLQGRAATCNDTCADAADLKAAISAVQQALAAPASPAAQLTAPSSLMFDSQTGDAAYVRAVSLINEGRYEDAMVSLDAAERVFGPHPDIITYKGYVSRKLGRLAQAEDYYRQALTIAPNHRGATEYYGELKVVKGDIAGARQMLAKLDTLCAYGCAEAEELRRWVTLGHDPAG